MTAGLWIPASRCAALVNNPHLLADELRAAHHDHDALERAMIDALQRKIDASQDPAQAQHWRRILGNLRKI